MFHLYNIYNILRIISNKLHNRIFDTSFFEKQLSSEEEIEKSPYDIFVEVVSARDFLNFLKIVSKSEDVIKCEFSTLLQAKKGIAHYQKFFGSFYGLYMENLEGRTYVMITNTLFNFKFSIPIREFLTVEDLGYLYLVKLLFKNCYIVHGGLAELSGRRILFIGLPGSGKTTLALDLLAEGAYIFSDDMTIVCDDGIAYGLPPHKVGLGALAEKEIRSPLLRFRLLKELLSKASYLRWLPYISIDPSSLLSISVERLNQIFHGKIAKGYGRPDYIILINYSNNVDHVSEISHDTMAEKILYVSMREWYYMDTNPLLLKYAYVNENFSFKTILDKRIEIIKNFIKNSKATTVEITVNSPRKLKEKVLNLIGIKR